MAKLNKLLVVADDITGADDVSIMFRKSGHPVSLFPFPALEHADFGDSTVLVADTDSRFVAPQEAYDRVYAITKKFAQQGVTRFYNKQCSAFRGNVGAEFDAMLDAAGRDFAPVILGFPDNGRTTVGGIHYINGVPLENSQFRHDPVNPMTESSLKGILAKQTARRVSNLFCTEYDKGPEHLARLLAREKAQGGYVIFDVRDNRDLALLAGLLREEPILCASSAIGYYLGLAYEPEEQPDALSPSRGGHARTLCLAGSLTPQTRQQIDYMERQGTPVIVLNSEETLSEERWQIEQRRILEAYRQSRADSDLVLIHTCWEPERIAQTKCLARQATIPEREATMLVSTRLAEVARIIAEEDRIENFIVCGGDTSGAFCRAFGVKGMRIGPEIETGVPLCLYREGERRWKLVLKSGSFGSEEFLSKAYDALLRWDV